MTLRELIEYIYDNDLDTDLHTSIYNNYYTDKEYTLPNVIDTYNHVVQEIAELPSYTGTDNHILVESVEDEGGSWVHVGLLDTATGDNFAIDFVDWSELVDLMIEDRVGLCHYDRLAHVLWELTFHGFNREDIREQALKLEQDPEDSIPLDLDDLT